MSLKRPPCQYPDIAEPVQGRVKYLEIYSNSHLESYSDSPLESHSKGHLESHSESHLESHYESHLESHYVGTCSDMVGGVRL